MATAKTVTPFKPTEAPPKRSGAGRPPNAEMVALIEQLTPLPKVTRESADGWHEFNAPDVSAFRQALTIAGQKMNVSFQTSTLVKVTDDDKLNPGIVKFRKVDRIKRERKPKENGN